MTPTEPHARALVRSAIAERIAKELFYAEVLEGRTERSATWEAATTHEQALFLADARAALRRRDVVANTVAMHKARKAAELALPQGRLVTHFGRQALNSVLEAAIAAHQAHLSYALPFAEEQEYERIQGIARRDFALLEGGK